MTAPRKWLVRCGDGRERHHGHPLGVETPRRVVDVYDRACPKRPHTVQRFNEPPCPMCRRPTVPANDHPRSGSWQSRCTACGHLFFTASVSAKERAR